MVSVSWVACFVSWSLSHRRRCIHIGREKVRNEKPTKPMKRGAHRLQLTCCDVQGTLCFIIIDFTSFFTIIIIIIGQFSLLLPGSVVLWLLLRLGSQTTLPALAARLGGSPERTDPSTAETPANGTPNSKQEPVPAWQSPWQLAFG